jgi:hypothetical protein
MRLILSLLLITSISACNSKQPEKVTPAPIETPAAVTIPTAVVEPVSVAVPEAKKVKILLETKGFTEKQVARLEKIRSEVEVIVNSTKFKEHVVGFYTKGKQTFNETKLTNDKIFVMLTDKDWQVKIEYARGGRSVLGWTNPSTPWIWFNSRYFDGREDEGLAGTFCHEMAHKFGFGHAFRDYNGREFTIPYGVGTICSQLFSKTL